MARQRRKHSKEFRSEVVRLVTDGGKSIAEVARAHELADSLIHTWIRQARTDAGNGPTGALTTSDKEELSRLRREVRDLKMERDFLKKVSTWFAGQSK